jgi:mannose-6-phosphate isomerase-like protein (cupin superfamily)
LADGQAERFIAEFFPGLTLHEAKLGQPAVKLSPKFLLVEPGHRLSWQYHHRRAERWHFLTPGAYSKSMQDVAPEPKQARAGTIVQFEEGERHRLCALDDKQYTLVAEIWQHTDESKSSNEADIVRLEDDYRRV